MGMRKTYEFAIKELVTWKNLKKAHEFFKYQNFKKVENVGNIIYTFKKENIARTFFFLSFAVFLSIIMSCVFIEYVCGPAFNYFFDVYRAITTYILTKDKTKIYNIQISLLFTRILNVSEVPSTLRRFR